MYNNIIEMCNYGFKYAKELSLDVDFNEVYTVLNKSINLNNINDYTSSDIEDLIEGYYEDELDRIDSSINSDFFEEEKEEEIDGIYEYEDEYEYEYECEY